MRGGVGRAGKARVCPVLGKWGSHPWGLRVASLIQLQGQGRPFGVNPKGGAFLAATDFWEPGKAHVVRAHHLCFENPRLHTHSGGVWSSAQSVLLTGPAAGVLPAEPDRTVSVQTRRLLEETAQGRKDLQTRLCFCPHIVHELPRFSTPRTLPLFLC